MNSNLFKKAKEYSKHVAARQMSWYTIGQFAIQLFSFVGVIFTARYLGPINLGLYSFVLNYLSMFLAFTAGMDFYFTWHVAKSDKKLQELKQYIGHKINITLFLACIGFIAAWSILPKDVAQLATIMLFPLLLSSTSGFFHYAIVTQRAKMIALVQIVCAATLFSARMILIALHAPLVAFVFINALDLVFVSTVIAWLYIGHKNVREVFTQVRFPTLRQTFLYLYSIRYTIAVLALWQILLRIDQLTLALFSNAHALGIYAVAVKISEVPNVLAGIFATTLIPYIAAFMQRNDQYSKHRVKQVMNAYFISGLVISIAIIVFAPFIVHILYGGKFNESTSVLRAYALSIPGMFVILHYFAVYGALGKHIFQSIVFTLGIICNILLLYFGNMFFGLVGVGAATAIVYNLVAYSFYVHLRKEHVQA